MQANEFSYKLMFLIGICQAKVRIYSVKSGFFVRFNVYCCSPVRRKFLFKLQLFLKPYDFIAILGRLNEVELAGCFLHKLFGILNAFL